ncbi:MAG: SPFH domain-containing protein [Mariprofundaceae bacterium]|nr:SPFH domain-containing protein [Mariprofundaceae bacterium]
MAKIRSFSWFRHLGSDPNFHLLRYKNGRLKESGRGLSFLFFPMGSSVVEVPMDDRELTLVLKGRAKDFQEITINGTVIYRIVDAELVASRVNFTIDLLTGRYLKQPVDQIGALLVSLIHQSVSKYMATMDVIDLLESGLEAMQGCIATSLLRDKMLVEMGIEVVSARVLDMKPTSELEKALEAPTRESIQQQADEATFSRRALAVEKESAIAENELKNQIELTKRERMLIEQKGENAKRSAQEEAETKKISAVGEAERSDIAAKAKAARIHIIETVQVEAEHKRMAIYEGLPPSVMLGLAARELAGKLDKIEHLNITPDTFGTALTDLFEAGTQKLKNK